MISTSQCLLKEENYQIKNEKEAAEKSRRKKKTLPACLSVCLPEEGQETNERENITKLKVKQTLPQLYYQHHSLLLYYLLQYISLLSVLSPKNRVSHLEKNEVQLHNLDIYRHMYVLPYV